MSVSLFAAVILATAPQAAPQDAQGPVVTQGRPMETAEALRYREAVAYANPLPRGAPTADYPLVAWCEALVNGHIALGETLTSRDPLDLEIIRLGRLEARDFRSALATARPRQTSATLRAADAAAAEATAKWAPLKDQDEATRSQAFGLFFGLPGRCEHAARRIRENITTPPATPAQVGIDETPLPAAPARN